MGQLSVEFSEEKQSKRYEDNREVGVGKGKAKKKIMG